jgi:hypothetical protein
MFTKNINGNIVSNVTPDKLRILVKDTWKDVDEEELEKIKVVKSDKLTELKNNPYRIFAVISNKYTTKKELHKNLKLVEVNEKKTYGGTSCSTKPYDLDNIIGIFYKIVKKSREENNIFPYIGKNSYTLEQIKKLKGYDTLKKYIYEDIYINKLKDILKDKDTEFINNFIKNISNEKEKKKVKKYIGKDEFDDEDILTIIKTAETDRAILIEDDNFKDEIRLEVEEQINTLSEEEVDAIGNMLDKKTASDICFSLRDWFEKNDLYINETDLNEI